jgi:hypothetical protein
MKRSRPTTSATAYAVPSKTTQQTTSKGNTAEHRRAVTSFRDDFTTLMLKAAKQAKLKLLTGEVSTAVRGDYAIANALIAPPKDVPIEEADRMFFVYLSFPATHNFAKDVPSGFYTIERMAKQKNPRAKVVNQEGKTVLELPLNIRKIELAPHDYGSRPLEQLKMAQATIEQSQETLYQSTRMQAHGIYCFPAAGVWYWTWA